MDDKLIKVAEQMASELAKPIYPISKRIAYVVSHGQSYASNGYAIRTHGIASALNNQGWETLCFVRPGRPWELDGFSDDILPEVEIDGVRYIHTRWSEAPSGKKERLERSVERLVELFRVYRPSAILAASNYIVGLPAWVAAKRLGIPFHYEVRGFWELSRVAQDPGYEKKPGYRVELLNESFLYQKAGAVITLNERMRNEIISRGCDMKKVIVVPCSVNNLPEALTYDEIVNAREKLGLGCNLKVVSYIGSFSDYESLDRLIDSCRELVRLGREIVLLLVGDGGGKYKNKESWIVDVGRVRKSEIDIYYQISDLIVIPREGSKVSNIVTPTKIVEALSFNKKVLVSNCIPTEEYSGCRNLHKFSFDPEKELSLMIDALLGGAAAVNEKNVPLYENSVHLLLNAIDGFFLQEELKGREDLKTAKMAVNAYLFSVEKLVSEVLGRDAKVERDYLDVSKCMKDVGLPLAEYEVLKCANKSFPRVSSILSALFWSSQRIGDYGICNKIITEMQVLYDSKPNVKLEAKLKKFKSMPAYLLSIFDYVGEVDPLRNSIKNKVSYVLHNSLPFSSGGYATRGQGLIEGISKSGLKVTVITRPGYPLDIKDDITVKDVPLVQLVGDTEYKRILTPQRRGLTALEYMKEAADALEQQFREDMPSVVMAASNHVTAIPAYLAAKRLGLPFIYEVRGFWEITRMSREPEFVETSAYKVQVLLESIVAQRADFVFTLTQPMKGCVNVNTKSAR